MKLVFYQISQFPTSFSLYLTEFQIFPVKPHVNIKSAFFLAILLAIFNTVLYGIFL